MTLTSLMDIDTKQVLSKKTYTEVYEETQDEEKKVLYRRCPLSFRYEVRIAHHARVVGRIFKLKSD